VGEKADTESISVEMTTMAETGGKDGVTRKLLGYLACEGGGKAVLNQQWGRVRKGFGIKGDGASA